MSRRNDPIGLIRHTSDSKIGRQMRQAYGAVFVDSRQSTLTKEQIEWNKEVERKRQLKKAKKCP